MGAKIRWLQPDKVYEMTIRTVDRTFLFTPNHNRDSPLLDADSSFDALNPRNDVIPIPSVINIFGAAIGRALIKYPIQLHAFESNIYQS